MKDFIFVLLLPFVTCFAQKHNDGLVYFPRDNYHSNDDTQIKTLSATPLPVIGLSEKRSSTTDTILQLDTVTGFNDSITSFSWELFQQSKLPNPIGNLILSPVSLQFLLGVLETAAEGETKRQIENVIKYIQPDQIQKTLKSTTKSTQLLTSAGIFLDSSNRLNETFENNIKTIGGEVMLLNFHNPDGAKTAINQWVATATKGEITEFLSPSYQIENSEIILASVIYFKSPWKYQFKRIGMLPFYTTPEQSYRSNFMEATQNYMYNTYDLGDNQKGIFVEIPYQGNEYSMVIIMPDTTSTSLDSFIRRLNVLTFNNILKTVSQTRPSQITLRMPQFRITSRFSVVNALLKMGLVDLFTVNSYLPYITKRRRQHKISDIYQQAVIAVDEYGTVAAAASGFVLVPLSASRDTIITIDKPFLSVIFDKKNNIPLFVSKIYTP